MDGGFFFGLIQPYVPNILAIIFVIALSRVGFGSMSQILRFLYKNLKIPKGYYLTVRIVLRLFIYGLTFFTVLLFIPGFDEKALALVGIGIGVVVSLSSTTTIGNVVAGFIIHFTRPIREGDRVEIDGMLGDVVSIELLFVHLKTVKDVIVSIPSLQVLNNKIINYSPLDTMILYVRVTLGYDLDPAVAEKLLLRAAAATEGILKDPKPFVLISNLYDHCVEYEINGYTDNPNLSVVLRSNISRNIIVEFSKAGVQIMSPHYLNIMELPKFDKIIPEHLTRPCDAPAQVPKEEQQKKIVEAKAKLEKKKQENIKLDP